MKEMLNIQLKDNVKARILDPGLTNQYNNGEPEFKIPCAGRLLQFIKNKHHIVMKIYHNPIVQKAVKGSIPRRKRIRY
jgi:polyphosphate kinase